MPIPITDSRPLSHSPVTTEATFPFISVIVPVRNEAAHIEALLTQLFQQDYPADRFEVIVADGRSTDATRAIVRRLQQRWPALSLLDNPGRLSSAGRNRAVLASRGELIVLIDGHCEVPDTTYLTKVANAFARSQADCLGRPQPLETTGATVVQRAVAGARTSWLGHNPHSWIYSAAEGFVPPQSVAVAYRREVFDRIGLFDEHFDACEDVEFNHRLARAGGRCFFTPAIQVRYCPRASLGGLFRQMMRYGRGRARLLRKHPDTFSLSCCLPALLLCWWLLGGLLAFTSPVLLALYALSATAYLLTLLVTSLGVAMRRRDWRILPWLIPAYLALHGGAGTGFLVEIARPFASPRSHFNGRVPLST
jgi:GT2 family glycosyltransferase